MIALSYHSNTKLINLFLGPNNLNVICLGSYYETTNYDDFVKKIEKYLFLKNLHLTNTYFIHLGNNVITSKFYYDSRTLLDFLDILEIISKQSKGTLKFCAKSWEISKKEFIKLCCQNIS